MQEDFSRARSRMKFRKFYFRNSQMTLEEVEALAAKLATSLVPPRVIALSGDLGAGKTTFVRAFVQALPHGDKARVKSPTFALHHEYATEPVCHHMDLYRLTHGDQLDDLGLRD